MASADNPSHAVRVLMVDDFEPWRRELRKVLQGQPEYCLIAEAANGLEAVQMAQELQPGLILLDINLPDINGIQVARRIRQIAPNAVIIFVSQISDADVVRAAFSTGARGFLLKMDVGNELFAAMEGALSGDDFVSKGIKAANSGSFGDDSAPTPWM